jgi:GT2 family glycosyltransferase
MITLIIPTLNKPHLQACLDTLKHIPFEYKLLLVSDGKSWPEAINIGLAQSDKSDDVILMDDDVQLTADTFKDFQRSKAQADIIGFKLLFPDGTIQHAGGYWRTFAGIDHYYLNKPDCWIPFNLVCHATTSLIYIKRHVLNELEGMRDNEKGGIHFQDLDFSWRALKAGFRIGVHPYSAFHHCSQTVGTAADFPERLQLGKQEVYDRHLTDDFKAFIADFPMEVTEW